MCAQPASELPRGETDSSTLLFGRQRWAWLAGAALALLWQGAGCGSSYGLPRAWVPRGPDVGRWPDAGAVALEDVTELRFVVMTLTHAHGDKLVAIEDRRQKLKILRPEGLTEARFSLPIDAYSTVTRVTARSISPDGQVRRMPSRAIAALARAQPGERAPELKTLDFTVPGAEVGGVIEVRYERVHTDPLLVPVHVFAGSLPTLRSEYAVVVPRHARVDYRFGRGDSLADIAPIHSEAGELGERLVFIEQDVPPVFAEPQMAHPSRNAPWLSVALREAPATLVRRHQAPRALRDWNDVAAELRPLLTMSDADAFGSGGGMSRLQDFREHLKPLSIYGLGVRQPQSAAALWQGTPACSRDAAALLVAMWRAGGATAYPALAVTAAGPPVSDDFPAIAPFTQAVVALEMTAAMLADQACDGPPLSQGPLCGVAAGQMLFVDPLCRLCGLGTRPAALGEGRAMLIAPDRHGWQAMPLDPPQRNLTLGKWDWTMDATGAMRGAAEAKVRGVGALALRQRWAQKPAAAAWRAAVAAVLLGPGPTTRSRDEQSAGLDELDQPVVLTAVLQAQATRRAAERFTLSARLVAGDPVPVGWRGGARRTTAMLAPSWFEATSQVEIPPGYRATLPPPLRLVTAQGEYAGGFSQHGQMLRFSRRMVVKRGAVPPEDWGDFVDFVQAVDAFELRPLPVFARDE